MDLFIDHESILGGVKQLEAIGKDARNTSMEASRSALNASFSGVSGLDQLGGKHGGVINGGAGSAITVLQSYAEQVSWLSGALAASYEALTGQNAFVARGMDIADEGGAIGQGGASFPVRPRPRFESFTFTPPVVLPATSMSQLSADFSATRIQDSVVAARMWHQMSADVADIAAQLQAVASDLGARNQGDVVEAAISRVSEVARAGETFAMNSQLMGSSVERLSVIKQQGAVTVNLAMAAIAAIPDPVARQAAESSFLASFPASYTPTVATGIPPIRNLMVMDPAPDGGGEIALGGGTVEGTGSKHNATGLRAPGAPLDSLASLQRAIGAGEFTKVQAGMEGLTGVGRDALVSGADVGTTTASVGTLTAPPGLGAAGAAGAVPAGVTGGVGSTGVVGAPLPRVGAQPVVGRTPSYGAPLLPGIPGSLSQVNTTVAGTGSRTPLSVGSASSGLMGPIGSLQAGRSGGWTGGGAGVTPVSGARPNSGIPGTPTMEVGGGAGAASRSAGTTVGRGMMPMMGAPMAGQPQPKASKVRAVTSVVEEEGNVAAILGDRPAVVPGVIGTWARA